MACSTPVIASATGGSAEYLRDGENCLVAAPGDANAIVSAIERLSSDPALRRRLVEAGRKTASRLTTDALARTLEDLAIGLVK
jgi:colanic acid/amylovoran biosynthesis glycosyltransferase